MGYVKTQLSCTLFIMLTTTCIGHCVPSSDHKNVALCTICKTRYYLIIYIYIHILIYLYLLTPWCRVLLEKLTGLQIVKKFPTFLWNPEVHYRTHKRPPPVPILGQPNPVHIPTTHLLEIHPNIIHTSTPRSPQWSLSLRFPHQEPIHPPLLTHTRHVSSPSHSSRICIYIYISILIYMYIYPFLYTT